MKLQVYVKYNLINWKDAYNTNLLLFLMDDFLILLNLQPAKRKKEIASDVLRMNEHS